MATSVLDRLKDFDIPLGKMPYYESGEHGRSLCLLYALSYAIGSTTLIPIKFMNCVVRRLNNSKIPNHKSKSFGKENTGPINIKAMSEIAQLLGYETRIIADIGPDDLMDMMQHGGERRYILYTWNITEKRSRPGHAVCLRSGFIYDPQSVQGLVRRMSHDRLQSMYGNKESRELQPFILYEVVQVHSHGAADRRWMTSTGQWPELPNQSKERKVRKRSQKYKTDTKRRKLETKSKCMSEILEVGAIEDFCEEISQVVL